MCFGKSCRSTTFQSSSTCALASRLNPTPAAGQMPTTESSPNTSSKIIPRRTPAQLPTTVWRGFGSWTARSMSCSRILMADGGRLMVAAVSCCAGYDSVCGQLARPAMTAALIPSGARNRENLHHVPINPARYPETGSGDGGGRTGRACRAAFPYAEIAELAPYAVSVQVKTEIHRKGAGTNEEADLGRVIAILREARYAGYVVLEYEAAEDPLSAIPRHIKKLRELIS